MRPRTTFLLFAICLGTSLAVFSQDKKPNEKDEVIRIEQHGDSCVISFLRPRVNAEKNAIGFEMIARFFVEHATDREINFVADALSGRAKRSSPRSRISR